MSLITTVSNPLLSEKAMLGFVKEKEQGRFFAKDLLPERKINSRAVNWKMVKNTRETAPVVREGSEETLTDIGYDEMTASVLEIREGAMMSEQSIQESDLRDLVSDHLTHLTDRNILKQEQVIFSEIVKNAGTTFAQVDWSDTANAKPLDDVLDAIAAARQSDFVNFDTMVISPDREMELLKNKEVKDILMNSQPSELIAGNNVRALGRIRGLDVYVATSVLDTESGQETVLDGKKTILMKRGSETGNTMVRENLQVRRFVDEGKRAVRLQVFKTFYPVIYKPQNIGILPHA